MKGCIPGRYANKENKHTNNETHAKAIWDVCQKVYSKERRSEVSIEWMDACLGANGYDIVLGGQSACRQQGCMIMTFGNWHAQSQENKRDFNI